MSSGDMYTHTEPAWLEGLGRELDEGGSPGGLEEGGGRGYANHINASF